jgi:hypothetical protein
MQVAEVGGELEGGLEASGGVAVAVLGGAQRAIPGEHGEGARLGEIPGGALGSPALGLPLASDASRPKPSRTRKVGDDGAWLSAEVKI